MAINKPVKKGTNQRVSQAKGLLPNVGKYKDAKTLNLKKTQLGAGGRKAASTRKIAISKTQYDPSRKQVLGPMGKPITGRVDMGGGNIAVYKQGVRVTAKKAAASKPKGGGGGGGGNGGGGGGGNGGGKLYEERKAAIGSGTTKGKPRGAGVPYEERKQAIGGGNARPRTKMQEAARANPYLGGRARAVQKQKDGSYSTSSGNKGTTARAALLARKAQDKKNESRDNTFLASLALAPLLAAGGVAGGAGAGLKAIMAARGAAAGRGAATVAGRAAPRAIKGSPPRAIEARATTGGAKISYGRPGIQKTPTGREVRGLTERGGATARPGTTKPLTAAQKRAATRKANAAKKKG